METLTRHTEFSPAWDKRHTDPNKNYGIRSVGLLMYVKGERGAYQFQLNTPWHVPGSLSNNSGYASQGKEIHFHRKYEGNEVVVEECLESYTWGVDYHSYEKTEYGTKIDECKILGGTCYGGGSGLYGTNVFGMLVTGGSEAVFKELERLYFELFYNGDQ